MILTPTISAAFAEPWQDSNMLAVKKQKTKKTPNIEKLFFMLHFPGNYLSDTPLRCAWKI
jgi:hypothetical protein